LQFEQHKVESKQSISDLTQALANITIEKTKVCCDWISTYFRIFTWTPQPISIPLRLIRNWKHWGSFATRATLGGHNRSQLSNSSSLMHERHRRGLADNWRTIEQRYIGVTEDDTWYRRENLGMHKGFG